MRHGMTGPLITMLLFLTACGDSKEESKISDSIDSSPPSMLIAEDLVEGVLVEITHRAGIDFVHETGATGGFFMPETISGGGALLDFDNDGRLDIYLVSGGPDGSKTDERGAVVNQLYRNLDGEHFERVAKAAGAEGSKYGMGVAVGDANGDGSPDLYLTNLGEDELLLNDGKGHFVEISGVGASGWSSSAAFLDYNADGALDIFVARYVKFDSAGLCFDSADRREYCGPKSFPPMPDVLLRGDGQGGFVDVSIEAGIGASSSSKGAAGLGVACADFDEDGWPDVYVANDAYANNLWLNQRDETFIDDALILGVAFNMNGQAEAGMGVIADDFDDNGTIDLFMTHLVGETNTYYRNLGAGIGFVDTTGRSGLAQSSMVYTGFGVLALDLELDGDLDLLIANGRVKKGEVLAETKLTGQWARYAEPNLFYLNQGGGRFEVANELVSAVRDRCEVSRGWATGDIDGDGDLDVLLVNTDGPARLYRNDSERMGKGLLLDVRDGKREALGARVRLVIGDFERVRTVSICRGFQSSSDVRVHFGLPIGLDLKTARIEVRWIGGDLESFEINPGDGLVEITRGTGKSLPK
ncbi:MAG: hypothetical protein ACI8TQ_002710 [Planctomycetota bacterium]|jgi:hypothetical protein